MAKGRAKTVATLTAVEHEQGNIEIFVSSHPDGCDLEKLLVELAKVLQHMSNDVHNKKDQQPGGGA